MRSFSVIGSLAGSRGIGPRAASKAFDSKSVSLQRTATERYLPCRLWRSTSSQHPVATFSRTADIGKACNSSLTASPRPTQSVTNERFPFPEPLKLRDGSTVSSADVAQAFQPFVEEKRMERIRQVAAHRTFNVLPIVEGVYDMGNLSAICRSVDALSMGALHIINASQHRYKQSARNSAGAEKWLDIKVYKSAMECIDSAKAAGFQVVVTHLAEDAVDIRDIDWTIPTAIVLGNEKLGVSDEVRQAADVFAVLPTHGMVQSLNVSVAAALMLNEARRGREAALGHHADLTEAEQACLQAAMILRHNGRSEQALSEMLRRPPPTWQERTHWYSQEQQHAKEEQREAKTVAAEVQTSH